MNQSKVKKFFTQVTNKSNKCNLCLKLVQGSNTTNMKVHLKKWHKQSYQSLVTNLISLESDSVDNVLSATTNTDVDSPTEPVLPLTSSRTIQKTIISSFSAISGFKDALKSYSTGIRNDYQIVIDGGFIREPQRRIWIENQRRLDLAMRLFNEGRYTALEFLICTRHLTPTFGVIRPQGAHNLTPNTEPLPSHTELQPQQSVNLPPRQTYHLPSNSIQNPIIQAVTLTPVELQPRSLNSTNHQVQHFNDQQNNYLALQARARKLLIEIRRVNGAEKTILDLIHDDEVVTPPERFYVTRQDLNFLPIVEPKCYICLYLPSTVIASPCNHQGLCQSCFESYIKMPPYENTPYYRCALCRAEVEFYMILNN